LPYYIIFTYKLLSFLYAQINKYYFLFKYILTHTAITYLLLKILIIVIAL
ncbi:hypothetical protein K432DRAFT_316211, partial [Lepidopterella palustris CBS 459.81]